MSDRYFDRNEAEELLPVIASVLNEARQQKQQIDSFDHDLTQAAAKIMVMGGSIPPHRELAEKRVLRDQSRDKLKQAIEQIQEIGCVLKDLDEGLVDFPALINGNEVYLCWKLGEERIAYWHGLDEGFAGRKPIEDSGDEPEGTGGPHRLH